METALHVKVPVLTVCYSWNQFYRQITGIQWQGLSGGLKPGLQSLQPTCMKTESPYRMPTPKPDSSFCYQIQVQEPDPPGQSALGLRRRPARRALGSTSVMWYGKTLIRSKRDREMVSDVLGGGSGMTRILPFGENERNLLPPSPILLLFVIDISYKLSLNPWPF